MKNIIRIVDMTTGGGIVLSGSADTKFEGIVVAREGDPVSCLIPGHGPTVIA
ncbi:PAAR domain-containing protein [Pseudomonas sp. G.S.17]|uniref:PAAR domain-containing protein n=1 Tax=Pseudomonas sp. G.S.17 TaxID=3137451 RepID=UPI00311CDEBB